MIKITTRNIYKQSNRDLTNFSKWYMRLKVKDPLFPKNADSELSIVDQAVLMIYLEFKTNREIIQEMHERTVDHYKSIDRAVLQEQFDKRVLYNKNVSMVRKKVDEKKKQIKNKRNK